MTRLGPEQEDLLAKTVEMNRSILRDQRDSFLVVEMNEGHSLMLPGVKEQPRIRAGDVQGVCARERSRSKSHGSVAVRPALAVRVKTMAVTSWGLSAAERTRLARARCR